MDMVGWVGAGMEVVVGVHADKDACCSHVGRCRSTFRVQGEDTRSHRHPRTLLWVGSSRNRLVFRGRP